MIQSFDPIVAEGDQKPAVRPGTVVVAYDGTNARTLGEETKRPLTQPVLVPTQDSSLAPSQPMSNASNPPKGKLAMFGLKAAELAWVGAKACGQQLATAIENTSVGARILGGGDRYFLVDIGKKSAEFVLEADSKSPGIPFKVTLSFEVKVNNPAIVVEQGVRDIVGHHSAAMRRSVRDIATRFSASEMDAARADFLKAFIHGFTDDAVLVSGVSLRVVADQEAVNLMRQVSEADLRINAIDAQSRVGKAQREMAREGLQTPTEVLAAWLSSKDDRYREIYSGMVNDAARSRDDQLKLLQLAMEKGIIEPHEIQARYPQFADVLLNGLSLQPENPELIIQRKISES